MEKVPNEKMIAKHTAPIVAVFKQKFAENFKRLAEGARTCILWVQYHYMVDVIKIFIRTERLANYIQCLWHIFCIVRDLFSCNALTVLPADETT